MAVEEFIGKPPRRGFVGELKGFRPKPLDVNHCDNLVWQNSPNGGIRLQVFEMGHVFVSSNLPDEPSFTLLVALPERLSRRAAEG
jgi:hypothetical protein